MSRPRSPHTGDLDAVLRDDLALEQIARGRRPRGADGALKLLCALAEDVEIRVPRRRMAGSRFTRGVIATAVAATVLGVTGVAAAQPGGSGGFALWTPRPNDAHISAADRSLAEARRSLAEGRTMEATAALNRADAELREAGASSRAAELKHVSTTLRAQTDLPTTPHPLPTTQQASPSWPWAWGIPGGGPGWQPSRPPFKTCLIVVCVSSDGNGGGDSKKLPYRPQQTPGAGTSSSSGGDTSLRPLLRLSVPTVTARPTTPGVPSPSSPSSPSARPQSPSATSSPSRTTSTTKPTAGSGGSSSSPQPSATATP
ncbi:MAG TPA: hypothetical protein VF053_14675 [Streptosporangiales bacterium]